MSRRVTEHSGKTFDGEILQIVTVFEPGVKKQDVKRLLPYDKKHKVLVSDGSHYRYKQEKA